MLGNAYGLMLFVMRDQATVAALLDEDLAVDNVDTDLADIDGVALFNKNLVSVMVSRLHAVTADRNHEARPLRFLGFGNKNLFGNLAVKDISRACGSRKRVIIHSQHTALGFPAGCGYSPVLTVNMQPSKTFDEGEQLAYISGYNCIPEMANESFLTTQKLRQP